MKALWNLAFTCAACFMLTGTAAALPDPATPPPPLPDTEKELNIYQELTYQTGKDSAALTGHTDEFKRIVRIPDELNGLPVTAVGAGAFRECTDLTELILPDTVTEIGEEAFIYCHMLEDFPFPYLLTEIGAGAFRSCENLKSPVLPFGLVTIGDSAFRACHGIKEIDIPETVSVIGENAFAECSQLICVTIRSGECILEEGALPFCAAVTAPEGSAAQQYAEEHNLPFEVLRTGINITQGDPDKDGIVSVFDAQAVLQAYTDGVAGNSMLFTVSQRRSADINGDGSVGVDDAQYILKYYTEKNVAGKDITWESLLSTR